MWCKGEEQGKLGAPAMGRWTVYGVGVEGVQENGDNHFNLSNPRWSLGGLDLSLEAGLGDAETSGTASLPTPYYVPWVTSHTHASELLPPGVRHRWGGAGGSLLSHTLPPSPARPLATVSTQQTTRVFGKLWL